MFHSPQSSMTLVAILVSLVVCLLIVGGGIWLSVAGKISSQVLGVLVFGAIGAECLGAGGVTAWDRFRFGQRADSVWGEVIDDGVSVRQNSDGQLVTSYATRVRFVAAQGQAVEFIGPVVVNAQSPYARGARVEVLYLPEQPRNARIRGFDMWWLVAAALFIIGAVFGGIALRVLFQQDNSAADASGGQRPVSIRGRPGAL